MLVIGRHRRTCLLAAFILSSAIQSSHAQLTTGTTGVNQTAQTGQGTNQLQQLLSNFQGLGSLGGLNNVGAGQTQNGGTGLTSGFGLNQTGSNGNGGFGGGGTGSSGQVTAPLVQNQFTAHRGSAVAARRPGLQLQQALAIHTSDTNFISNTTPIDNNTFFRNAFEQLILTIIESFTQGASSFGTSGLGGLNSLTGLTGLSGLFNTTATPNQQTTITPIQNATTTGQGASTTLP